MATGYADSIFKAECGIPMTSLKFDIYLIFNTLQNFHFREYSFLSINLDLKHAKPNFGKIFKTNTILITKYLNLNWNIVRSYTYS